VSETNGPKVEAFIAQLEAVPWFSRLGAPTPFDAAVARMHAWDDWPGPEEPAVDQLCTQGQELYDRIMAETDAEGELTALQKRVREVVIRLASPRVPYVPDQDAWYPPNAAVWQAVFSAGLIALCVKTGHDVPAELREQWCWFVRGHWPAGYASFGKTPGPLLIY
jgi:hypothetical protein